MQITRRDFGRLSTGEIAQLYTITNDKGMTVSITDFGGAIVSLLAPDRRGKLTDVVMGYDSIADYEAADGYLGALVGRVANRIDHGHFTLDGVTYDSLCINNGENHLHGGRLGISKRLWQVTPAVEDGVAALRLTIHSPDGEEGYPGNMDITVTYTLDNDNSLAIRYAAVTDKACPVNLTNHVYLNLAGNASGKVLSQHLWMDAESYCRTNEGLIPTGELVPVDGTPFDFREGKIIGRDIFADDTDLLTAGGYDHCFNFTGWKQVTENTAPILRAVVTDPVSGRRLELYTDQPCTQFYTANFLKNPLFPLRGGQPQQAQTAFCLETQKMPDGPNHQGEENYTDCILRPGETYRHTAIFRFTTD